MSGKWYLPTPIVVVRNIILLIFFLFGCVSIVWTQRVFLFILKDRPKYRHSMINLTKRHFLQLFTFVISILNSTTISITYDPSKLPLENSFSQLPGNLISTSLSPNSVMISNHQIYTDWFYLWFLNYTSRLSEFVYIIMKDMSKTPILGYGMTNFNFMFLSRKWDEDKIKLTSQLLEVDANARGSGPASGVRHVTSFRATTSVSDVQSWPKEKVSDDISPYQILLFPEGTVPSLRTTKKSREFCDANNLPPLKHVLLPRIRGLFLVLRKLRGTVEVVYDITTAYGGLKAGEFGEDIFTLKGLFLLSRGPEKINYHFRSFRIEDIPLGDDDVADVDLVDEETLKKFENWLFQIWYEKDALMDSFYKHGSFVSPNSSSNNTVEKVSQHTVEGGVKLRSVLEIIPVFGTAGATVLLLVGLYRLLRFFF
ncbi:hypothetical protein PSN45_000235 [Yamadazyma tenuis]|uniref:Phospholipid/glycerol acyltransferase domain-containing protein n=1 Tax=Candida tenuis (strain ATCC 10573 / BCRC 21748 / CBS 615 / JCM 9827 / NBRC 10315 / NRRL Y-1498 / VKM Y-70) TaxID=590646 RepID=G3BBK0_CANTC|nr:uncharacterized protein CANTEDRAFT_115023 [Yamadazyma tenuis ATCC 10573]EGV61557.1 hypothetical protein CANTEDRAFT_115023 [Yamadazyma tenuis ATCC 10573]WEJ92779.1 hypothetical protein PSN45_000235 [Yamadazyma tenuis]